MFGFGGKRKKDDLVIDNELETALRERLAQRLNGVDRTRQASSDQRISRRETDYRVGSAVFEPGRATSCRVVDKSHAGLRLELQGSEACPEEFALTIPTLRFIGIVRKAWQSESQVGVTIVRWQEAS